MRTFGPHQGIVEGTTSQLPFRYEGEFHALTFFAGLGLSVRLSQHLGIEAEAVPHLPLTFTYPFNTEGKTRWAFTLGLTYNM